MARLSGSSINCLRDRRRGLTLLELILALGLASLILYAVSMAIDFHLRTLDVRRANVEEAQVARATLQMIANDLRSTVREYRMDTSAIEQMLANSMASAAGEGAEALGLGQGGNNSSGTGSGQGAGTGTGSGNTGNGQGSGTGNPSGGPGQSPGGGPPGGQSGPPGNGGFLGGGSGSGSGTGSGSGSGSNSSGTGSTGSGTANENGGTENTEELASTTQLPPTPGLYGNQYQLQIDVSRLPRADQYQSLIATNNLSLPQIPSDVKTVTYYVQTGVSGGTGVTDPFAYGAQATGASSVGLVRREVDRSVVLYAQTTGTSDQLMRTGELISPEVTSIQFQYFDGFQWLPEWDSAAMKSLPVSVEILISVTPARKPTPGNSSPTSTSAAAAQPIMYRLVVQLPLGEPIEPESSETTDSGLESVGL